MQHKEQSKRLNNEYHTTMVCVDICREGQVSGRLYNPYFPQAAPFQSAAQMLLTLDGMLDEMNFPQDFVAKRTFAPLPPAPPPCCPPGEPKGKRATFALRVLYRQHASWQGSVTWLEGNRTECFRSALELLHLLDSALRAQ